MLNLLHDAHLHLVQLVLEFVEKLRDLNSNILCHDLRLDLLHSFLHLFELVEIDSELVVYFSCPRGDKKRVFVFAVVKALLAAEVHALGVKANERLASMLLAGDFVVNHRTGSLSDSIPKGSYQFVSVAGSQEGFPKFGGDDLVLVLH